MDHGGLCMLRAGHEDLVTYLGAVGVEESVDEDGGVGEGVVGVLPEDDLSGHRVREARHRRQHLPSARQLDVGAHPAVGHGTLVYHDRPEEGGMAFKFE